MKKTTTIYILFSIVVVSFLLRTINAPYIVFPEDGEIIFTDNDAPYHALRIIEFAKGFTNQIQFHDPRSYYPEGHVAHWAPGFDFVLGLLGRIFYFIWPDDFGLKIFVSLLIPVLGTVTLFFFYLFARSFMNSFASLIATALLGLLPFHIPGTYFAIIDHHVAEYLFIILLYLALTRLKEKFGAVLLALVVITGYWVVPAFLVDYIVFTVSCVFALTVCGSWKGYPEFAGKLFEAQLLSFL